MTRSPRPTAPGAEPASDADRLRDALKRSASALKADGVPFALAGSYALWVHGAPESTHDVLGLRIPVLAPTDVIATKLEALSERYCDFGQLLPPVRAVREQLDWPRIHDETADNPFAAAFLVLAERLGKIDRGGPEIAADAGAGNGAAGGGAAVGGAAAVT